jgi:ketosteroid isomerase-like protein
MNGKPSLFSELRRRNVFRVALTYAVVAWLLIEIAAVLLPMLDAPEWIITAFVVLLALGFAVAMFISWAFEMTPEGLKRTEDLSPDEVIPYWSRRKFARFIIGTAVIAFGLSAYQLLVPKRATTFSPASEELRRGKQSEPVSISQPLTAGSPSETTGNIQPLERILRDLDAQWSRAAAAKDVERTIAYYSDEAIVLPPNATSATTKEAIRNIWKDLLASPGLVIGWQPTRIEVGKSADMAWVSGTYELTINDASGNAINDRGKYVEVWKKQPDGNWKCAADMWNSDLPVSAPATAEKK